VTDDEDASKLRAVLHEAVEEQRSALEAMQRNVRLVQQVTDNRHITAEIADALPREDVRRLTVEWQRANDATRAMAREAREWYGVYSPVFLTTATTTSASSVTAAVSLPDIGAAVDRLRRNPEQKSIRDKAANIAALLGRHDVLRIVMDEMKRCGLDQGRGGRRSPLALLKEAELALEQPSGPEVSITGALIALRQSIERAVLDLLGRCVGQSEAPSWKAKVQAIGMRCQKPHLPSGYFDGLGESLGLRMNHLSGVGKDRVLSRQDVLIVFLDGLNFLRAFLEGLDEAKLR
jgi:hypothetical protein